MSNEKLYLISGKEIAKVRLLVREIHGAAVTPGLTKKCTDITRIMNHEKLREVTVDEDAKHLFYEIDDNHSGIKLHKESGEQKTAGELLHDVLEQGGEVIKDEMEKYEEERKKINANYEKKEREERAARHIGFVKSNEGMQDYLKAGWWLINKHDAKEIQDCLVFFCANYPVAGKAEKAKHVLSYGLHKTDAIPSDFDIGCGKHTSVEDCDCSATESNMNVIYLEWLEKLGKLETDKTGNSFMTDEISAMLRKKSIDAGNAVNETREKNIHHLPITVDGKEEMIAAAIDEAFDKQYQEGENFMISKEQVEKILEQYQGLGVMRTMTVRDILKSLPLIQSISGEETSEKYVPYMKRKEMEENKDAAYRISYADYVFLCDTLGGIRVKLGVHDSSVKIMKDIVDNKFHRIHEIPDTETSEGYFYRKLKDGMNRAQTVQDQQWSEMFNVLQEVRDTGRVTNTHAEYLLNYGSLKSNIDSEPKNQSGVCQVAPKGYKFISDGVINSMSIKLGGSKTFKYLEENLQEMLMGEEVYYEPEKVTRQLNIVLDEKQIDEIVVRTRESFLNDMKIQISFP